MCYDLHSHTDYSDGELSFEQLVERAATQGVTHLAITDHDTVRAHLRLDTITVDINIIPGVEISCDWEGKELHIVGLHINPQCSNLQERLERQVKERRRRALHIAEKLEKQQVKGALHYVDSFPEEKVICRTHLSTFLIERQYAKDSKQVFKRFLGKQGKSYVKGNWMALAEAVSLIRNAGGIAVLAHPGRYGFSNTKLKVVTQAFVQLGGRAIEVCYPNQKTGELSFMTNIAQEYGLAASVGSDFHAPKQWTELGRIPKLPESCQPVWELFGGDE